MPANALRLAPPELSTDQTAEPRLDDRLLLSARNLAAMMSLSIATVRRLDAAGKLPRPIRLAGSVRWRADELRRWCDAGCPTRGEWEALRDE
jgi:predicted DNA-binding transcriptional regulator AlpA